MKSVASLHNTKCSGCQKPLYYGVQPKPNVSRPAGYSLGYLCEECVDYIVCK